MMGSREGVGCYRGIPRMDRLDNGHHTTTTDHSIQQQKLHDISVKLSILRILWTTWPRHESSYHSFSTKPNQFWISWNAERIFRTVFRNTPHHHPEQNKSWSNLTFKMSSKSDFVTELARESQSRDLTWNRHVIKSFHTTSLFIFV